MQKITPFLWFDKNAEEAMNFYTSIFNNSKIVSLTRYPDPLPPGQEEGPMKGMEGKVLTGVFELEGFKFMGLDGGPIFKFNPSVSFSVRLGSVEEVDKLFNQLVDGGSVLMPLQKYPFAERYGWLQDKYGLSWQISTGPQNKQVITPSFMFVGKQFGKCEEAINFYASVFKDSKIDMMMRYEKGEGQDADVGKIKFSAFNLAGQQFFAMENSAEHKFEPSPAISMYVECEDQEEVDAYWEKLSSSPADEQCGWLKDKYGFSWQIIPKALPKLMNDPDKKKADAVMNAMMKMKKIVVADLEKAAGQ